jgi:hypothetical protein
MPKISNAFPARGAIVATAGCADLTTQDCEAIMAKVLERSGTVAHKSNTEGT